MNDSLTQTWRRVRDWTYENYHWAYLIGTGVLCQSIFFPSKKASLLAWGATTLAGAVLEPCVNPVRQVYGRGLWRLSDQEPASIALTFDDGPGPDTPALLELLREHGVVASFFCVGQQVERYPELMRQIAEAGHMIGNHSYSHPNLMLCGPDQTRRELALTQELIERHSGQRPQFWRPPYGFRAPWTQSVAGRLGLSAALWSINPRDFQNPGPKTISGRVLEELTPGSIVLFHDGFEQRGQTLEAVKQLLPQILAKGYRCVRLDQAHA